MDKYINEYVEYLKSEGVSFEKTISHYVYNIKECCETMDINTVEDLESLTWIDMRVKWLNVLKNEGMSGSSLNLRITSMKSFLTFMQGKRLISVNVAKDLKKYKTNKREVEIDEVKIKQMISILEDEFNSNPCYLTMRNKFMIKFLLTTGLRMSELTSLNIDSIGLDGKMNIIGKFDKERTVYLPQALLSEYQNYMQYRLNLIGSSDALFVSKSRLRLDKNATTRIIKKYSKMVGLELTTHSLRHICATELLASGNSLSYVSDVLGHSNTNITYSTYIHSKENKVKETINNNKLIKEVM